MEIISIQNLKHLEKEVKEFAAGVSVKYEKEEKNFKNVSKVSGKMDLHLQKWGKAMREVSLEVMSISSSV